MDINTAHAFDGLTLYAVTDTQIHRMAQEQADANGAPVAIWTRDGWSVICEDPEPEPDPEADGWELVALVAPIEDDDEPRRKLTRQERLEGLADSGCDTWSEYRCER